MICGLNRSCFARCRDRLYDSRIQMSSVEPERQLLHYRIVSKIGQGGMGQVYRAEDTKLGRHVALKLLSPDSTRDLNAKRRLLTEAQSASALNHPNIVTIYAIEEADGHRLHRHGARRRRHFDGAPAHNGALPLASLLDVGIQIADALQRGARHRHHPSRHQAFKHPDHAERHCQGN